MYSSRVVPVEGRNIEGRGVAEEGGGEGVSLGPNVTDLNTRQRQVGGQ